MTSSEQLLPPSIPSAQGTPVSQGGPQSAQGPANAARRAGPEGFPVGTLVQNRYKILGVLGRGGSGTMYEAEDVTSASTSASGAAAGGGEAALVAIKALSLRGMRGWKDLELFQREASVLRNLSHPGIPEYIDFFEVLFHLGFPRRVPVFMYSFKGFMPHPLTVMYF